MVQRILAAFMAILMTAAGAPGWAADCGDTAGVGGARVACDCGDSVITNTVLKSTDPVVNNVCTDIGLIIFADNITLNCHGHELIGEPNNDGIFLADRTGVTVRNCTITGFLDGIQLIRSNGNSLITNTIVGSDNNGIDFEDDNNDNLVKGNRIVAAGNDAINFDVGATGNTIVTNVLDGAVSFEDGIDFDGPGVTANTVRGNVISGFGDSGIELEEGNDGNLITENRSIGNFTGILVLSNGNTIERNTTNENFDDGIWVQGDDNTIDRNRGRLNEFNGLEVSGTGNTVSRNTFDDNFEFGICVAAGNTDGGGNRGQGNGAGQVSFACP